MSSEISSIDRCTGMFFSCRLISRPNSMPSAEIRTPTSSSEWPSMPMKLTCDRSGRIRFASPPAGAAGVCAAGGTAPCASATAGAPHITIRPATHTAASHVFEFAIIRMSLVSGGSPDWVHPAPSKRPSLLVSGRDAHPIRQGRAASQKNPDALLHREVRKGRFVRGTDKHVTQIQVVGRDVDRVEGLGSPAAVHGELLGQKAQHRAPAIVLEEHHPLESGFVVG